MNPVWPVELQKYINTDSFNYAYGSTVLRSEMDLGPAKVRRRATKSVDMIDGAIDLPMVDFTIFDYFFRTQVNGGARVFDFAHPITRATIQVRFKTEPQIKAKGGTTFVVSMSLEVMP